MPGGIRLTRLECGGLDYFRLFNRCSLRRRTDRNGHQYLLVAGGAPAEYFTSTILSGLELA